MSAFCCENGIDFATESIKGCRNGFFFAVFVFFVAKKPFSRGFVVSGFPRTVAADGFSPQKWGNLSGSLSACFACFAVNGLLASVLPGRLSQVGYRWVTLGNGNVLAENRFFPPYAGGGAHALPSKAGCRKN